MLTAKIGLQEGMSFADTVTQTVPAICCTRSLTIWCATREFHIDIGVS